MEEGTSLFQCIGAGAFGLLIGWYVYWINRHRTDSVTLADIGVLIGAIGGAAVLALFPAKTDLFASYGIGLVVGFFGYFAVLLILVKRSKGFTLEWFLDGRKPKVEEDQETGPVPMGEQG